MNPNETEPPDRYAPKGKVWQCQACGKLSPYDLYGDKNSDAGWDVSCVMNAVLIDALKPIETVGGG